MKFTTQQFCDHWRFVGRAKVKKNIIWKWYEWNCV